MSENFANNFSTVLTGPLTATATTLAVASSTGAPPPNFRIAIDQEILLVTAVSGTSWTVARGQENTTATAHLQGAVVQAALTAGGLADLPYVPAPTVAAVAGQVLTAAGTPPVPTWAASSGTIAAATRTALSATADASLPDGQPAFNEESLYRANWQLSKTSTLTADGVTVLATNSGTGRWILKSRLAGTVPVVEVGADPTGSVDSSGAVNAAFASGVAAYFPPGTYNLSAAPTIPAGQTIIVSPQASFTGTGATEMAAIAAPHTLVQLGTASAPTNTKIASWQPADQTKAPFQIILSSAEFNSTWDNILSIGYMGPGAGPEPTAYWGLESDYNVDGTSHLMEMYWTFNGNPGDAHDTRALYAGWERTGPNVGQMNTYMTFGNGGSWQIQDSGNGYAIVLKATATALTFGETAYTLQGSGALTVSGGTNSGASTLNLQGDAIAFGDHAGAKWASFTLPETFGSNLVQFSASNAATVGFVLTGDQAATTGAGLPVAIVGAAAGPSAATNTLGGAATVAGGHCPGITGDGSHFFAPVVFGTNGINATTLLPNIEYARLKQDGNGATYLDFTANGYIAQVKATELLLVGTTSVSVYGNATQIINGTSSAVSFGVPIGGYNAPLQTNSVSIALGHGGTTTPSAAQTANPTLLLTDTGLTSNAIAVLPTTTGPAEWTVDLTGVTFSSHTVTLQVGTATKTIVVSSPSVLRIYSDGVGKLYAWTAA